MSIMSDFLFMKTQLPHLGEDLLWRILVRADPNMMGRAFVDNGPQVQFNVPTNNHQFDFYVVIGSDHGNVCLRISMGGLNFRLLIWNPLTGKRRYASDESIKHLAHAVSIYTFDFLEDTVKYRILHDWKKNFS
ncbi:hypothetical protein AHAS_Ahas07G0160300 [Arachis hypogaea]